VRLGAVAGTEQSLRQGGILQGRSVLVVDDNSTSRQILVRMLANHGLNPISACSAAAALEALRKSAEKGNLFDLIVLDAHMPGMDGFTVAQRILPEPRFGGAKIVLLTSAARPGESDRARALGVLACLTKPVGEKELLKTMSQLLQPTQPANHAPPKLAPGITQQLRLLVVEDNPVNSLVARRLLEKQNHRIQTATNGREALEKIESERFDCVLMDLQMPVLDGFAATAVIRDRERVSGEHLPIVALTAHAIAGDLERCLAAGMDGYLTKPIDAKDVVAMVERVSKR
jgi:CheY-like chemotaxis protein